MLNSETQQSTDNEAISTGTGVEKIKWPRSTPIYIVPGPPNLSLSLDINDLLPVITRCVFLACCLLGCYPEQQMCHQINTRKGTVPDKRSVIKEAKQVDSVSTIIIIISLEEV
jgi:hypothetical protein